MNITWNYCLLFIFLCIRITQGTGDFPSCTEDTFFQRLSSEYNDIIWSLQSTIQNITNVTCAVKCYRSMVCKAVALRENGECVLLGDGSALNETLWSNTESKSDIFFSKNTIVRFPVFRLSSESGFRIQNTWLSSSPSSLTETELNKALNLQTSLTTFYKHPLLNDWTAWEKNKMYLYLYTEGHRVVSLEFNVEKTASSTSWFTLSSLISSSWTDLTSSPINYFVFENPTTHDRRFYINSEFGGCPEDLGWMVLYDAADVCNWSFFPKYPMFKYAIGDTKQNWDRGNIGTADDLVIFVEISLRQITSLAQNDVP